ncbi:hypothetical protein FC95_GL001391 [Lentilactobacillus kefiri DSM 20587 = JCM 5818]|uniref:Uncharacterized protein n=1 Tax=Lentilactobacillus kefiri DSM 20587 = JCM 5818 TaxID=1423764 RepID=A0A8E1RIR0_LENKE|nr:hypothetical protein FD08_GL003838 [Lentilactobacillus parakefiri DSM 10551]KRM52196.1 hypothetical protein FC95_GL001391 [Lentilactobacillus kefiri DSM 20587 = JCM 5818]
MIKVCGILHVWLSSKDRCSKKVSGAGPASTICQAVRGTKKQVMMNNYIHHDLLYLYSEF